VCHAIYVTRPTPRASRPTTPGRLEAYAPDATASSGSGADGLHVPAHRRQGLQHLGLTLVGSGLRLDQRLLRVDDGLGHHLRDEGHGGRVERRGVRLLLRGGGRRGRASFVDVLAVSSYSGPCSLALIGPTLSTF